MSHREERKLARRLVGLERRADAARTKQLPFTAIELDDGTSQGITDGVSAAVDAYALAGAHDEGIGELGDIADASAIEGTFLPERLAVSEGSADAAFELGLIASERVGEALTAANDAAAAAAGVSAIAEGAKTAADAAQAAAGAASTTAAEAKAAADQAAADAVTKAAEAEAAAKEYAAAQAAAAEAAAKAAASDDAAAKADAAEAAAKLAAAADAKAKADAAQAAAEEKAAAAQSTANGAATAAADAATRANAARELALQNMRYRQVDGGAIEPPEPEGGFRINAQRVKVNAVGTPYQVDRWSGTAWVRDQTLADQILVLDENGAVSIGDAKIVAPTIIGGDFFGNRFVGTEFEGATITGSTISIEGKTDPSTIVNDTGSSVTNWSSENGTTITRDTAIKETGTSSVRGVRFPPGASLKRYISGAPPRSPVKITARIRVSAATHVTVRAIPGYLNVPQGTPQSSTLIPVEANTWTTVVFETGVLTGNLMWMWAEISIFDAATTLWIDSMTVVTETPNQRKITLGRSSRYSPALIGTVGEGSTSGRFQLDAGVPDQLGDEGSLLLSSWDERRSYLTPTYFRFAGLNQGATISARPDGMMLQTTVDGGTIQFWSPVKFQGDKAYARLETAIPGATLGPGVIHGVNSLYVGLQAAVKAGVLYISGRVERSGGMPANHVLFTLPPGFRPSVPDVVYAYSSAGHNFVVVQPNGECILALASSGYVTISKMTMPLNT